jgi:hypothetical protein
MGLRIGQFATTCYVPQTCRHKAGIVEEFARGRLSGDLGAALGPSLSRQPAIVRIRRLSVRVILPASELTEESLSKAWMQALMKAIFTALAYPSLAGPIEVFRAETVAGYLAGVLRDLLDGVAASRWYYEEFREIFQLGNTQAALTLLCRSKSETLGILLELARAGQLDRLLARFDELALEKVFGALAIPEDSEPTPLPLSVLISAAKLALANLPAKASMLRTRRFALQIFVAAQAGPGANVSLRALHRALSSLWLLMTNAILPLDVGFDPAMITDATDVPHVTRLSPDVQALVETITREMRLHPQSISLAELNRLIDDLRVRLNVVPPPAAAPNVRTITSEWCGLFFLASTLNGFGWVPSWMRLSEFQRGGISNLLAGIALTIAGQLEQEPRRLDPGLALFAGYFEEADLGHLRRLWSEGSPRLRLEVLEAALGEQQTLESAETWDRVFDRLAGVLIERFASRLRGFKQAARSSIVQTFLKRTGQIRIEDSRIVVVPEPSAYHVVLHISGMDSPVGSLSWLNGRRLEFEVGDL